MNLKDLMEQFLKEEGFCPKQEEFGLAFKCEGKSFLFIYDDDDEQYFRLMMPCIFDMTEENRDVVLHAMNEVNSSVKVIKAYTMLENEVCSVTRNREILHLFGKVIGSTHQIG